MRFLPALALAVLVPQVAAAQSAPETSAPPSEAYFEFMLARRLEAKGESAAALEALKRAQTLDPKSAEILAEMAGLYARQNKGAEAIDAAPRGPLGVPRLRISDPPRKYRVAYVLGVRAQIRRGGTRAAL